MMWCEVKMLWGIGGYAFYSLNMGTGSKMFVSKWLGLGLVGGYIILK